MKALKKLLVVVVALLVVLFAAIFYLDSIAGSAIEKGGTYATGVPVTLDKTSIGLLGGTFSLSSLKIANPPGYDPAPIFELKSLETGVSLGSLRGDVVEVPKLVIDGVRVRLDVKDGKPNYAVLTDNLKRFSSASSSAEEKSGKKVVIRELIVKDVAVSADLSLLSPLPAGAKPELTLPTITLKDVGAAGGGSSLGEAVGVVVAAILNSVGGAGNFLNADFAKDLTGRVGDMGALTQQARAAIDQAVGGAVKEAEGALKQGVDGALKDATDKLGGLLGGKK
jgi:hypothetical protein